MAPAKNGDTVKVNYTGKLESGEVFDTSRGREPLEFTLGTRDMIPGFEAAVVGMNEGDSKTVVVASDDAYGPPNDELLLKVQKEQFPEEFDPEVGQHLQVQVADGTPLQVRVAEVAEEHVVLDANHPLAGKDLTFEIEMVEISAAE